MFPFFLEEQKSNKKFQFPDCKRNLDILHCISSLVCFFRLLLFEGINSLLYKNLN